MAPKDASCLLRKRYLVTGLVFLGWFMLFMLRTNLSICLVDMTSDRIVMVGNETTITVAEFNWTSFEKGVILSSFSWGYIMAPVGAFVARRFGGAVTCGVGIGITGLFTVLTPYFIQCNLYIFLAARFFEGVSEGVAAASSGDIFRHWSPPSERFFLISFINSGAMVGSMMSYPISGSVAYYLGWRAVFYFTGGLSLIWYIIWATLVRNTPANDSLMSSQERLYLKYVTQFISPEKVITPWKQILASKVIWAYMNERFMEGWSASFLTYSLPIFIKDVHENNIRDIGYISGIPHFCGFLGTIGGAVIADYVKNREILSITKLLKLYLAFAQSLAAILLIISALWMDFLANNVCFSVYRLIFSVATVYYDALSILLGGNHASSVMGLGIMTLAFGYALSPLVMGLMVQTHSTWEWSRYFLLLSFFNVWGGIIFYRYGSGELQHWAVASANRNDCDGQQSEYKTRDI